MGWDCSTKGGRCWEGLERFTALFDEVEVRCAPSPAAAVNLDSLLFMFVGLIRVGRGGGLFPFSSVRGFPDIGLLPVLRLINGFRDGTDVDVLAEDVALPGRRGCANEASGASSSEVPLSEVASDVSLSTVMGLEAFP